VRAALQKHHDKDGDGFLSKEEWLADTHLQSDLASLDDRESFTQARFVACHCSGLAFLHDCCKQPP
jgi:hypothetical protein